MEGSVLEGNISTKVVSNRALVNPDKYPNSSVDHITYETASYLARDPLGIKVGVLLTLEGGNSKQ